MQTNTITAIAQALLQEERNATALSLFRRDNPGSEYLRTYAPHLYSQLDSYTAGWTLVPKAILFDEEALHQLVGVYRENLECAIPQLPPEVTEEQFRSIMDRLLNFLEKEVAPVLAKMPKKEEVKEDVAEELAGYDFNGDTGEDEGEISGEDSNS